MSINGIAALAALLVPPLFYFAGRLLSRRKQNLKAENKALKKELTDRDEMQAIQDDMRLASSGTPLVDEFMRSISTKPDNS